MANRAQPHAEHMTIMMLDLCGYTHISSRLSRQTLHELHDVFDALSVPTIEEHHGEVIKKIGDAFLAVFKSPTNALHCAIALQNKFSNYNRTNRPKYALQIKIAVHTGEIIFRKNDIYGDAVNITSRIIGASKAGDILFSGSVFSAMNKSEIPSVYLGRRRFKGVGLPVKIYKVRPKILYRSGGSNILGRIIIWIIILTAAYFILRYFL